MRRLAYILLGIAMGFSVHAQEYSLGNCVNELDLDKAVIKDSGYQYWFIGKEFLDGRTLKMSVVKPDKSTHPPHRHEEDEMFYILEGKASFYLDGKTIIVGPHTSLYCPSMSEHGLKNVGKQELKYLVIKKYQQK
ncbi:cupin domain-containing protein [Reichenbachiella agarivorans]|uniref:Cupin domain-containing protein n=1 Tax=Reichenbachiella agarivorans TaxID=2979464 RepID=A0ABY6CPD8_9BACT|nr:cupin domain-containing protein [Reichenbachiella agarivorans]UXP32375.1 cupin domain-containing protein [Reichenbachiella agarivorans]